MRTHFTPEQLSDPDVAVSEKALRACVHCGFCNSSCPTFTLLGDELDSPRGRIYLIKNMLEADRPAGETEARHIDRCLSCLSCQTTCPSGVHYQHLVDHARVWIEDTYARPWPERLLRGFLARVMPRPALFRWALLGAKLFRPIAPLFPKQYRAALMLSEARLAPPSPVDRPQVLAAQRPRRMRVALLPGCVQTVLDTSINEATVRLLTRNGCEVVIAKGTGCCGALPHHLGKRERAHALARANLDAWRREIEGEGLDAIVVNASGCGVVVKDYGHMFRDDPVYASIAAKISARARDIGEMVAQLDVAPKTSQTLRIAYHSACSLQHGQRLADLPPLLLRRAGFEVFEIAENHLCCGSAGTYNILQPDLSEALRARKQEHIAALDIDAVASGNIGCLIQLGRGSAIPVLHTIELLDWADGGPKPGALQDAR